MNTRRLNITISRELFAQLNRITNKSAFIAQAVREKLEADAKARRIETLAKAYREAAEEDRKMADDWDTVSGDGL